MSLRPKGRDQNQRRTPYVLGYWRWAHSDIYDNAARRALAHRADHTTSTSSQIRSGRGRS